MPDRPALDPAAVALTAPWTHLDVVAETTSTNADLLASTLPEGAVLVAEHQTAGRGRLDRSWLSPPRAGLTVSVVLEPAAPSATWAWLPLLVGVAVIDAIGPSARLKWPNDVLIDGRKVAGILVQADGDRVVAGVGLNVTTTAEELPSGSATSLALSGGATDRVQVLERFLAALAARYTAWTSAGGDAVGCGLAADYRACCVTIGQEVRITSAGPPRSGHASTVDGQGRLVVDGVAVSAGDVEHVRPIP